MFTPRVDLRCLTSISSPVLIRKSERYGGYISFTHKVCEDQLVIYGDTFYQNVKTHNELAASAHRFVPHRRSGHFGDSAEHADRARAPNRRIRRRTSETGRAGNAFNPFNPFHQIISGGSRPGLAEFGNRFSTTRATPFWPRSVSKGTNCSMGTGVMISASVTARLRIPRQAHWFPRRVTTEF